MAKHAYSTAYHTKPGVTFPVGISDPKERIQAYLDSYSAGSEGAEVRFS